MDKQHLHGLPLAMNIPRFITFFWKLGVQSIWLVCSRLHRLKISNLHEQQLKGCSCIFVPLTHQLPNKLSPYKAFFSIKITLNSVDTTRLTDDIIGDWACMICHESWAIWVWFVGMQMLNGQFESWCCQSDGGKQEGLRVHCFLTFFHIPFWTVQSGRVIIKIYPTLYV